MLKLCLLTDAELCEQQQLLPCFTGEQQCYDPAQRCNGVFDGCNDGADEFGCKSRILIHVQSNLQLLHVQPNLLREVTLEI
jgi:hypothetical protein